jgi:hypothetical protein
MMSAVIPLLLFTLPSARRRPGLLATGAVLAVGGFVLNRADVGGIAHIPVTGQSYLPALTEIVVSLGVVSALALVFLFLVERFPVWEERPALVEHFTAPMQDPVTRTYFGRPWFGGPQMAGLGWIAGVVLGLFLVEVTVADSRAPEPRPVRPARTVYVDKAERVSGPGTHMRFALPTSNPGEGEAGPTKALLLDGDRAGVFVLFDHEEHQGRMGGQASCRQCHHRNLPMEHGTSCGTCHRDMYRATDTYSHQEHVRVLGGNDSCSRCHADSRAAKTRQDSKPCQECHAADTAEQTRVEVTVSMPPGMAPGYRTALHGLCIGCHLEHETEQAVEQPYLSRCTACHRGHSPAGEEMRLREGWSLSARLDLP